QSDMDIRCTDIPSGCTEYIVDECAGGCGNLLKIHFRYYGYARVEHIHAARRTACNTVPRLESRSGQSVGSPQCKTGTNIQNMGVHHQVYAARNHTVRIHNSSDIGKDARTKVLVFY